jgi:hypothetical protein
LPYIPIANQVQEEKEVRIFKDRILRDIKKKATNKAFWGLFFKFYEDCEEFKKSD